MTGQQLSAFFGSVYDQTYKSTLAYVTAHTGSMEDIADIMQETYAELYSVMLKKGERFADNPPAFVMHLAKTKLFRHYRRLEKSLPLIEEADLPEPALSTDDDPLFDGALVSEISDFIASKPLLTQKVFHLYFYFDMTLEQIASELGITLSGVKNRLYRTIDELRRLYKQ